MLKHTPTIYRWMVLALSVLIAVNANAQESDTIEKSFDVKKGGELVVDSTQGKISVDTWNKKEVFVSVERMANSKERLQELKIDMEQKGNRVIVEGNSGWRSRTSVKFNIKIPKEFSVDVKTGGGSIEVGNELNGSVLARTSGGSISVGDVDGDVDADTSGGSISVGKVTGTVKVDTSGGSIKIESGGKIVNADTSGGSIRIGPSEGDVKADTSGGSIHVGYTKGNVMVDTSGGSIRVEGSDGNVSADTSGGSITIDNTKGSVNADTSGGGIKITNSHAAIKADTSGGNITAELVEDDPKVDTTIDLDTSGGEITVYLPEKLKATVYAKLELNWRSENANIYSDFPLTISDEGDVIIARGDLNGGGDKITLSSVNGDIKIKKLKE